MIDRSMADHTEQGKAGPLEGLLIADFSRILAGPYATMLLADLGATVVKVEGPKGDDTRTWMPPEHDGVATYYTSVNRNKRSIVLDLKDPVDLELAKTLIQRSDVMIENFKPGQLKRFGLDFDTAAGINPHLIYASITGFGDKSVGATMMGYDLMVQAMSGLMSLTGSPDDVAYRAGISVFDIMAGMHATIGILAALQERHQSGKGQHVDVSLMASALSGLANHTGAYVLAGVVPYRMGNAHPSLFPYEPLPTKTGDLVVIAGNDSQFRALTEALGAPQLADDPDFARNELRTMHRERLRPILVELLQAKSAEEWFEVLTAANVPCAPIATVDQGLNLAASFGLEPTVVVPTQRGPMEMIRNPIGLSRTPPSYRRGSPALGEHSEEIRAWLTQ
ncbi:succinyl-CoA:(R)-benzylsuccinate CoA-transferase subunit BbsF [Ferrimicrobium acidiphilum DSM 19497]|uniref:Succinyl-CoA:(R)-benzylsuccinate CoA-transferase subunit BbsF n=2 Tax=Ferrimicrobium acidiphilum TaxID=121039 RepID=A0A0D8FR22_9ACTN|nr:CoA transferase [Ferrimicrobium acidiphilum]KJE75596.1 succinyl-CoA:(R)-benzylsuccinate CoA-transferase subunit BbsF [Ferrimicrobium acidiphilum DSM 19497]